MQGHRVKALTVFIALLALVGCKEQQQPPVPIAGPPHPTATASPDLVLNVQPKGTDYEVYTSGLAQKTVVRWHSNSGFFIQFDRYNNPCNPKDADPLHPGIYLAHKVPNSNTTIYEAKCAIASVPVGNPPFPYKVRILKPGTHPHPSSKPSINLNGHCSGCVIDK